MMQASRKEVSDNDSTADYASVSAQNKERRKIRFSSDSKRSFDQGDDVSHVSKRSAMEEILPIGHLTKTERKSLSQAFGDLFCCVGEMQWKKLGCGLEFWMEDLWTVLNDVCDARDESTDVLQMQ